MHLRLNRLRSALNEQGLDAFLVSSLPNIRYLTGFTGSNALCVVTRHRAIALTDSRYILQSREEIRHFTRIITRRDFAETASERKLLQGCSRVGFESEVMPYSQFRLWRKFLPGRRLVPTSHLVENISQAKESGELACIRAAIRISDQVFHDILPLITPGLSESDLAAEISYRQRRYGAEQDAFDVIVASGVRSALPHARPTSKKIRAGELLILDFGCVVGGYSSDLTRTVCVGKASRKAHEVYAVVLEAQRRAIAAARAGMAASELDAVARRSIGAAGYGRYFTHSLGHGLGLRVHEPPRVSALSKETLKESSVVTIEPGVYIPGYGGVRIEDDVLLTAGGCRVLTKAPKEFTIV
jgi:Xaa-Pro aminopeptidase